MQCEVIQNRVRQNRWIFGIFERKCSLTAKPSTLGPIVLYIFGKLSIRGFQISGWKSIFNILWSVRIFRTHPDRLVTLIWFLVIWRPIWISNLTAERWQWNFCSMLFNYFASLHSPQQRANFSWQRLRMSKPCTTVGWQVTLGKRVKARVKITFTFLLITWTIRAKEAKWANQESQKMTFSIQVNKHLLNNDVEMFWRNFSKEEMLAWSSTSENVCFIFRPHVDHWTYISASLIR